MGSETGVEITSGRRLQQLLGQIRETDKFAERSKPTCLGRLEAVSEQIKLNVAHLTTTDLVALNDTFSAAFKRVGIKPAWARDITLLIHRTINVANGAGEKQRLYGLPNSETSPHDYGSEAALARKMAGAGEGSDTRMRHDIAG